jgi:hypothetical protein
MEDGAEAVAFLYVEGVELLWIGDRLGSGCSGRALAMP